MSKTTLPTTENRPSQKETSLPTSNHPFSEAMLLSGRVMYLNPFDASNFVQMLQLVHVILNTQTLTFRKPS